MPSPGRPPQPPGRLFPLASLGDLVTCLLSRWVSSRSLAFGSARRTPRFARPRLSPRGRSFPTASSARVLPSLYLVFSASFAFGGGAAFGRLNPPPGRSRCERPTFGGGHGAAPRYSRSSSASLAAGWWGQGACPSLRRLVASDKANGGKERQKTAARKQQTAARASMPQDKGRHRAGPFECPSIGRIASGSRGGRRSEPRRASASRSRGPSRRGS